MSTSSLKTIDKAIDLLWAIAQGSGSSSVEELSSEIRLPKSTTYRFLKTLQTRGFVDASAEYGKYRLGPSLSLLSKNGSQNGQLGTLCELALPVMRRLTSETGETTFLCIKSGRETICIECIESRQSMITRFFVGEVRPLHVGAASKALLAFLPDRDIETIVQQKLSRVTTSTITDPVKLRNELKEIREKGHAYSDQEFIVGARAISAPVFDEPGAVAASLTLSAPVHRIENSNREILAARVVGAAREVSASLGWKEAQTQQS
ncbi:MAG: IclR family transcriptional regulator [Nitrospinae bacterium]|nr:IclR family transcriptional regulator [Nitrospinota bacterium]